jgi:hypothetical protein
MATLDTAKLTVEQLEKLDEFVHQLASEWASSAINSGEQVDFLLTGGWSESEIRNALGL